ncbi:Conserved hypothetical protein; putative membrane protein [Bradyrhizobium sp. ORS 278]|uniref:hypothetical protein n=1 Tax=Bradyrhizobium sp. (strain ORS 278) TaxID=114615 RepID=UPI0001508CAC|nr:hypothetical protein [Bradyrhizobium sp. ORS 278]CAL78644.1 Conserved hypothetical protein; putative membrane protein [Bradyrhizobium sp. ORS 278]
MTEDMPKSVWWFEKLLWGSLLFGCLIAPLDWHRMVARAVHQGANEHIPDYLLTTEFEVMNIMVLAGLSSTILLGLLFVWLAARRRLNWVRWLLAAIFLLGLPAAFANLTDVLPVNPTVAVLLILQTIVQFTALVFVFLPSARPWFWKEEAGVASA